MVAQSRDKNSQRVNTFVTKRKKIMIAPLAAGLRQRYKKPQNFIRPAIKAKQFFFGLSDRGQYLEKKEKAAAAKRDSFILAQITGPQEIKSYESGNINFRWIWQLPLLLRRSNTDKKEATVRHTNNIKCSFFNFNLILYGH